MNQLRRSRPFSFALLALALAGCAVPADGEATGASSAALGGAVDACESSPLSCTAPSKDLAAAQAEYQVSIDPTQTEIGGSTCRRVCACCARNGNRFCCSHCRFCSGPIGVGDVLVP